MPCAPSWPRRCIPVITTDGLRLYFYALTAHFGRWVTCGRRRRWEVDPALLYGQLHKRYQRRRLVRIKYQMCMRHPPRTSQRLTRSGLERQAADRLRGTREPDRAP